MFVLIHNKGYQGSNYRDITNDGYGLAFLYSVILHVFDFINLDTLSKYKLVV